jgi:hypothetical protein
MNTSHSGPFYAPTTSIEQWAASFSAIYAIKDQNIMDLGEIKLPSSGIALEVIKITPEMLQDQNLAVDIQRLAEKGLIGFASANTNTIQFREDIAKQLKEVHQFRVYHHSNLQSSHMEDNIQVVGIDEIAYLKLANLRSESTEKAEKEKKRGEHAAKEHVSHRKHHSHTAPMISHKVLSKKPIVHAKKNLDTTTQQEYQHRATHAKARKKNVAERERRKIEGKEIKSEEIERETKNREILHKGIRDSHQRANRNFGDEKESTTSSSNRGEALEAITKKTEIKRKTPKVSQEPTKRKRAKTG